MLKIFFSANFCLPLAVGIALIFSGIAILNGLYKFGFWLGLGMIGQAAGLQLIEAGHGVRYQHYIPFSPDLVETHLGILTFLATQSLFVFYGILSRWTTIKAWVNQNFRIWQLISLGLLFFFSSATVSREISIYIAELLFAGFLQAVNLGNIILIVWSLPFEKFSWFSEKS